MLSVRVANIYLAGMVQPSFNYGEAAYALLDVPGA